MQRNQKRKQKSSGKKGQVAKAQAPRKVRVQRRSNSVDSRASTGSIATRSALTPRMLAGQSGSATIAPMAKGGMEVVALHRALRGTYEAWELNLLETLLSPLTPYPLPGIVNRQGWGYNPATYHNGFFPGPPATGAAPIFFPTFTGDQALPDQSALMQEGPAGTFLPIPAMQLDTYAGSRYDQREGLVRGNFSVESSGQFIVFFDPIDVSRPVHVISVDNMETWWTSPDNWTAPIFAGGTNLLDYEWDRDPYRGYANDLRVLESYGSYSTNQFTYVGGAVLHLAVQAKTAYSDVAIKARNISAYDRRFFDTPTNSGEYGDPSQPEKANEAAAIYNGSSWGPVFALENTSTKAIANRLWYAIQRGLPLLEVHVVNATTGGAPVNFNFEARTWVGVTYTSLRDSATTCYHTVPAEIPAWFSACKMRGATTMHRSELGEAIITNTVNAVTRAPLHPIVHAVVSKVAPKKAGDSFFSKILTAGADMLGIDKSNPIPSIASLVTGKILPKLAALF